MARNRPIAGQRARSNPSGRPGSSADAGVAGARQDDGNTGTTVLEPPQAEAPERSATDGSAQAPPTASTPRQRNGRRLLAGLLALTLTALAAFGLVALRVRSGDQVETARDQAVAAAGDHAEVILSYDYQHLDKDFAAAGKALTGDFARDYRVTTTKLVRPGAEQYHVVVKAEVAASSVVSASADRVVVLLFVNQTTTSTRLDGPRVDLNRVRLTLLKVDGSWLVSKVVAL